MKNTSRDREKQSLEDSDKRCFTVDQSSWYKKTRYRVIYVREIRLEELNDVIDAR